MTKDSKAIELHDAELDQANGGFRVDPNGERARVVYTPHVYGITTGAGPGGGPRIVLGEEGSDLI